MAIVGMNCWPFAFNVTRDAASAPIWKTHALPNGDERSRLDERLQLGVSGTAWFCPPVECVRAASQCEKKVSTPQCPPRPGRHLCIIEPNPSTHL